MVWFALAVFTGLVAYCVAAPFLRPEEQTDRSPARSDEASKIASLKTALVAVDKDESLGLLSANDAQMARAEIAEEYKGLGQTFVSMDADTARSKLPQYVALASISVFSLVSFGAYAATGSPNYGDQRLSWRLENDQNVYLAHNLERLQDYLAANPDDAEGWAVIAPVYFEQENWRAAGDAYMNAVALGAFSNSEKADFISYASQAVINQNMGVFTPDAIALAHMGAKLDPQNIRARYLQTLAIEREGNPAASAEAWQAFITDFDADTSGLKAQGELRLAAMRQASGAPLTMASPATQQPPEEAAPPRGPTQEQMQAAAALSDEDRQAMIVGMVSGLAMRLEDNPNDLAGWKRLMRSYTVLGKTDEASGAFESAMAAFEDAPAAQTELQQTAASLGLEIEP